MFYCVHQKTPESRFLQHLRIQEGKKKVRRFLKLNVKPTFTFNPRFNFKSMYTSFKGAISIKTVSSIQLSKIGRFQPTILVGRFECFLEPALHNNIDPPVPSRCNLGIGLCDLIMGQGSQMLYKFQWVHGLSLRRDCQFIFFLSW